MKEEALEYYGDLRRIAGTLTSDMVLQDDLVQEGAISLLKAEGGNNRSWYLCGAKQDMQDSLRKGTSIDGKKREDIKMVGMYKEAGEAIELEDHKGTDPREQAMMTELRERITDLLTAEENKIGELKKWGYNNREIAGVFSVTRQAIEKRLKIIQRKVAFVV